MVTAAMKLRLLLLGRKAMTNLDSILKSRHYFANKGLSSQSYGFSSSHVWMWVGLWRRLSAEDLTLLNCGVGEDSCESLGLQDPTSPSKRKSVLNIHCKDWCWSWNSNPLDTWCEELTHWRRPWCWERLRAGGEGDDRGWDGWMASLMLNGHKVWVNSRSWWRTGRPGVLQSMESKSDTTEWLNWTSMQGVWIQTLVREPRSHMPQGQKTKT